MKNKFDNRWFKECKTMEEKDDFKSSISNAGIILSKVKDIIENELEVLLENKSSDYEKPAWGYYQADRIGQERAYKNILRLFKHLK